MKDISLIVFDMVILKNFEIFLLECPFFVMLNLILDIEEKASQLHDDVLYVIKLFEVLNKSVTNLQIKEVRRISRLSIGWNYASHRPSKWHTILKDSYPSVYEYDPPPLQYSIICIYDW